MRKSRVLLAGVAVAAAGVATSAFTASNTVSGDSVAGYGQVAVTGADVTDIHYVPTPPTRASSTRVVFTTTTDVTGNDRDHDAQDRRAARSASASAYALHRQDRLGTPRPSVITCDTTGSAAPSRTSTASASRWSSNTSAARAGRPTGRPA